MAGQLASAGRASEKRRRIAKGRTQFRGLKAMVSNARSSKNKAKSSSTVSTYADPLMTLLHSSDLNRDKQLSETLYEYIDDITDMELKKWCIDSLTVLRNLEKIETQLDQWEFHTLDFTLEVNSQLHKTSSSSSFSTSSAAGSEKSDSIRRKLARRVLDKSVKLRDLLSQQKEGIDSSIFRARHLSSTSPAKVITDAGTILIELTMRIVKLGKHLDEQVTVGYSRAKLTIIGSELKKLVTSDPYIIDKDVVQNYTTFVNNLLNQLNMAVAHNDTVVLWESVAIIGDVEKMFESMKQNTSMAASKEKKPQGGETCSDRRQEQEAEHKGDGDGDGDGYGSRSPSLHDFSPEMVEIDSSPIVENSGLSNDSGLNTDTTLVNSEWGIYGDAKKEVTVAHISAKEIFHDDNDLIRTKITEHIPELIQAFNRQAPARAKPEARKETSASKADTTSTDTKEDWKPQESQHGPAEPEEQEQEQPKEEGSYFSSYFKPSILNAFYQPQLKEPIYVNKENLPGGRAKETVVENGNLLTNATVAVRLDQMSFDDRSKNELLERERGIRRQEAVLDSQLSAPRPTSSSLLNQLSSSVLAKSTWPAHPPGAA